MVMNDGNVCVDANAVMYRVNVRNLVFHTSGRLLIGVKDKATRFPPLKAVNELPELLYSSRTRLKFPHCDGNDAVGGKLILLSA